MLVILYLYEQNICWNLFNLSEKRLFVIFYTNMNSFIVVFNTIYSCFFLLFFFFFLLPFLLSIKHVDLLPFFFFFSCLSICIKYNVYVLYIIKCIFKFLVVSMQQLADFHGQSLFDLLF